MMRMYLWWSLCALYLLACLSNFCIPSFFSCSPQSLQTWNDLCDALYQTFTCDWMNFVAPWYDLHCSLRITFQVTGLQQLLVCYFSFSLILLPAPPPLFFWFFSFHLQLLYSTNLTDFTPNSGTSRVLCPPEPTRFHSSQEVWLN